MNTQLSVTARPWFPGARKLAVSTALVLLTAATYVRADQMAWWRHRPIHNVPPELQVPAGNELSFRAVGVGVQIYVWTPSATDPTRFSWVLKAPHAILFDHEREEVGIHFAGPTWQNLDGSKVVATRRAPVTVDPTAIPWLLLQTASTSGEGVFADVTYIQRLNTVGGLAPATPGTMAGQEMLVPYVADYLFYRAEQ